METRSRVRGHQPIDIKLGSGGMADLEFIAQAIALRSGRDRPELRWKSTDAVFGLAGEAFLTAMERRAAMQAHGLLRRTETFLRLCLGSRSHLLPEEEQLEILARCMGFPDGPRLHQEVTGTMRGVRALFLEFFRKVER